MVSNATRWATFQDMMPPDELPEMEKLFLQRYTLSPSFVSIHMGAPTNATPFFDTLPLTFTTFRSNPTPLHAPLTLQSPPTGKLINAPPHPSPQR